MRLQREVIFPIMNALIHIARTNDFCEIFYMYNKNLQVSLKMANEHKELRTDEIKVRALNFT